jgi:hypothetical protein
MPEVGSIIMGVIVSILILFLACCLLVIGTDELRKWREHRKGKR